MGKIRNHFHCKRNTPPPPPPPSSSSCSSYFFCSFFFFFFLTNGQPRNILPGVVGCSGHHIDHRRRRRSRRRPSSVSAPVSSSVNGGPFHSLTALIETRHFPPPPPKKKKKKKSRSWFPNEFLRRRRTDDSHFGFAVWPCEQLMGRVQCVGRRPATLIGWALRCLAPKENGDMQKKKRNSGSPNGMATNGGDWNGGIPMRLTIDFRTGNRLRATPLRRNAKLLIPSK